MKAIAEKKIQVLTKRAWVPEPLEAMLRRFDPRTQLGRLIKKAAVLLPDPEMAGELISMVSRMIVVESALYGKVIRRAFVGGPIIAIEDLGLLSRKVITDAGVDFLVDAFQNITEIELLKFHGIGTGATAEAVGDTALVTELTTQYDPDNLRATGSTIEGASSNIYRTVGTNLVDSAVAITEHGIFDQAAVAGGTLWDRSIFSVVNLASGDSLQTTYDMTATAGG